MPDSAGPKTDRAFGSSPRAKASRWAGHVGMLVHSYYPHDQRVRLEAEALVDAGYRVDVVCLRLRGRSPEAGQTAWEKLNGVFVHRLPLTKNRGSIFRYVFEYAVAIVFGMIKFAGLHLTIPFDALHIHNMPDLLIVAGIPFKWLGAKLVLDVHDPMPEIYQSMNPSRARSWAYRVLARQECWSCRQATHIIVANEVLGENLVDKGVCPKKVLTVNNFPDPIHFIPLTQLPPWPKRPGHLKLIYSGTITGHYQVEDAVRAVAMLAEKVPGIRLFLVGSGGSVPDILELASALGIRDLVVHRDHVDQKTLRGLINGADVGVSTHIGGPFGDLVFTQKILDYLSQGLPVVANRARPNARYCPEEAVYYYDAGRPRELANQVLRIIRDPELRRRKGEYGLMLSGSFSWSSEKRKLVVLYHELTAPDGREKPAPWPR